MKNKHILLYLLTTALDCFEVADFDQRIVTQKTIYLVQRLGLDLGYRYSWHLKGPYSRELTKDYYELNTLSEYGAFHSINAELNPNCKELIATTKKLIEVPNQIGDILSKADWLELLVSIDFLRKITGQSSEEARATIGRTKPKLHQYFDIAYERLVSFGLCPV